MIPFGGDYTRGQWARGIRLAMFPTGRGLIVRVFGLVIAMLGLSVIVVDLLQNPPNWSRMARTAFGVVLLTYWAALPYMRAWRESSRPWRAPRVNPSLRGFIDSEGITSDASTDGAAETWGSFLAKHVRDDMVVLGSADGTAMILPRSFFGTDDHWGAFRQYVEYKVLPPE